MHQRGLTQNLVVRVSTLKDSPEIYQFAKNKEHHDIIQVNTSSGESVKIDIGVKGGT